MYLAFAITVRFACFLAVVVMAYTHLAGDNKSPDAIAIIAIAACGLFLDWMIPMPM